MADNVVPINPVIKLYNPEVADGLRSEMWDDKPVLSNETKIGGSLVYIYADLSSKLRPFHSLGLKRGYSLRGYSWDYRTAMGEGEGIVWAMPESAPLPNNPGDISFKPPEALDNIMKAIEGDGSLWSYLCASVFSRGMLDFGLSGHCLNFGMGEIIGNDFRQSPEETESLDDFKWKECRPLNFDPEVKRENSIITVTLHTYQIFAPGKLTRFVHIYHYGNYCFKGEETVIASDGGLLDL